MSGIPGAGKDKYVSEVYPNADVVSADSFFMSNGIYQFDASKLSEAHAFCMRKFLQDTYLRHPTIIVNNTNTRIEEIAPYYAIGKAYGAVVRLITIYCDVEKAAIRNVHGVPAQVCQSMAERLANRILPPFWEIETWEVKS